MEFLAGFVTCFVLFVLCGAVSGVIKERRKTEDPKNSITRVQEKVVVLKGK